MTTIDTVIHLLSALLPSAGVLAFLLLHRRQSIRADLEDTRLRFAQHQRAADEQSRRTQALTTAAAAFAPALTELVQRLVPSTPTAAALSDEELVAELDQRISNRGWNHGNPFAELDELLERLWSQGVVVPGPEPEPETHDIPPLTNLRAEA